ncbi:MAG: T9SS type A sorting domain-containing protein [Bacteroidota bacterium]
MKKNLRFAILLFSILNLQFVFAQKEANIWYFGSQAGMDFNSGAPVALTNGQLFTTEGSASIADANGNLLFYTEGVNVYNRLHTLMPNGTGLLGGTSASQSAIILPYPGVSTQYYIFTVPNTAAGGLCYSIVDMTLSGGNGDITSKNVALGGGNVSEKLTATYHRNGLDFWVSVHDNGGNTFFAYHVSAAGITGPVVSAVGTVHGGANPWTGCMKFSPKGDKMAVCLYGTQQADLLDFDNITGVFSNPATYNFPAGFFTYGVEFSESGQVLYICNVDYTPGQIYQFNMQAGNNAAVLATGQIVYTNPTDILGSMQAAPDHKVYFVRYGFNFAGAIEFPDVLGAGCTPNDVAVPLSTGMAELGLPDFFSGIFINPITFTGQCLGDTTFFTLADTANLASTAWNFRDVGSGIYNTSNQFNPYHIFTNPGNYLVQVITTYLNASIDTTIIPVHIYANVNLSLGNDTTICIGSSITLNAYSATATDYLWQDASTASTYTANATGLYFVTASNAGCNATDSINLNVISCSAPIALFQTVDGSICPGTCTDFTNMSINATSYQWFFPGANPAVSTDVNPAVICYNTPGSYDVTLIATDGTLIDTLVMSNFISVFPYPAPQGIAQSGDTLFANQGAITYQWYHDGLLIPGATDYFYVAQASGSFNVVCTDINNCEVEAVIFDVVAGLQSPGSYQALVIYPNPVNDELTIQNNQFINGSSYMISIYNLLGEKIYQSIDGKQQTILPGESDHRKIDCRQFSPGIYWLEINTGEIVLRNKFIKSTSK